MICLGCSFFNPMFSVELCSVLFSVFLSKIKFKKIETETQQENVEHACFLVIFCCLREKGEEGLGAAQHLKRLSHRGWWD